MCIASFPVIIDRPQNIRNLHLLSLIFPLLRNYDYHVNSFKLRNSKQTKKPKQQQINKIQVVVIKKKKKVLFEKIYIKINPFNLTIN